MEAITVFTENAEQGRVLKAFLKALKMSYTPTPFSQLEASLTPAQRAWWLDLKASIQAVKRGDNEGSMDAYDLLKEIQEESAAI